MGEASRWWLHHSLIALDQALGGKLVVMAGDPAEILPSSLLLFQPMPFTGIERTSRGVSRVMPGLRPNARTKG